jgi:hypothetical protein
MFKDARIGVQHSIPISTNFKIFKYFSASTSANYNEVWTAKNERSYNTDQSAVVDRLSMVLMLIEHIHFFKA